MAKLANHDTAFKSGSALVKHFHHEIGLVHPDVARPKIGIAHPAQPLHRDNHRFQVIFGRQVQTRQRALAHHAIRANAVVLLKALHGGLQVSVEGLRERAFQIAKRNQTVAQRNDVGGAGIRLDFLCREGRSIAPSGHQSFKRNFFCHKAAVHRRCGHKGFQPIGKICCLGLGQNGLRVRAQDFALDAVVHLGRGQNA